MRQPKDLVFLDASISNPIDNSPELIELPSAKIAKDERRDTAPSRTAAFLLKSRAIRSEQFRETLSYIDDISWHILLELMVSMNTGNPVTAHDLAVTHTVAPSIMTRYVEYLIRVGLIDKEFDARDEERVVLKLTASGDALTSKALRKINREIANF